MSPSGFSGLKCRANVLHILAHRVLPQCITILMVKINCLLHILWYIYPELVSLQPILGFHFCNYTVPLLQNIRYSPSEGGLHVNLICHGILQ